MKTEEITPGDILYEKERKLLVKVARVDEDGVVKCSAYTDMEGIFKTVPPPYRIGTHTADAYIPATDVQRKFMERNLAVCKYVNLPKNNRMETLAYIIADLKSENVKLELRVHQLMDDYNDVVHQLNGKEKRKDEDPAKQTLGEMLKMRDHCDKLEKDNEQLKRQCVQLQTERNEAKIHADTCEILKEDLFKHIARFENSEFLKIGDACTHRDSLLDGKPVKIGSGECCSCRHLIKVDVFGRKCVLCACRYDNTKAEEAQECKNTDKKD
jgi:hypothetical protein